MRDGGSMAEMSDKENGLIVYDHRKKSDENHVFVLERIEIDV